MTIFSIINSTAVLPTQTMENATITIEDGVIIDIAENGPATERYVNAEGAICFEMWNACSLKTAFRWSKSEDLNQSVFSASFAPLQ